MAAKGAGDAACYVCCARCGVCERGGGPVAGHLESVAAGQGDGHEGGALDVFLGVNPGGGRGEDDARVVESGSKMACSAD